MQAHNAHVCFALAIALLLAACGSSDSPQDVGADSDISDTPLDLPDVDPDAPDTPLDVPDAIDTEVDTDTTPTADELCADTDGEWDATACGHYRCGLPNSCQAVIPGCNCGPGRNFVDAIGCVEDSKCGDTEEQARCMNTGGIWDLNSCGHYECGDFPPCDAVIPGCNCGADSNFDSEQGCVRDPDCFEPGRLVCENSGGAWTDECYHAVCGMLRDASCLESVGACNCGPGMTFNAFFGCRPDNVCDQSERIICDLSGGIWDPGACMALRCGRPNECLALIPGCDCGSDSLFHETIGCFTSDECGACPDRRDPNTRYFALTPSQCAAATVACAEDERLFSNECGCGCIAVAGE